MNFKNWWENWFSNYIEGQLCAGTAEEYSIFFNKHYFILSQYALSDIKAIDIMAVTKTTSTYSNSRQRKVYFVLQRCLLDALANDLINKSPFANLKPPKKSQKKFNFFLQMK